MKKLSKKSVLLFAAVMALCAFAVPSFASAATFTDNGAAITSAATVTGSSTDLTLNDVALGVTVDCANAVEGTVNGDAATISTFNTTGCTSNAGAVDVTPTNLPWSGTLNSNGTLTISGISVDVDLTSAGLSATYSGSLSPAVSGNLAFGFSPASGSLSSNLGSSGTITGTDNVMLANGHTLGADF